MEEGKSPFSIIGTTQTTRRDVGWVFGKGFVQGGTVALVRALFENAAPLKMALPLKADVESVAVDVPVQAMDKVFQLGFERIANPQDSCHRNRTTCFDLLPMTSRKSKGNHILLAPGVRLA